MGLGLLPPFSFLEHLVVLALGVLLQEVAPRRLRALQRRAIDAPMRTGTTGVVVLCLTVGAIVLAAVTLVGIPLAVALGLGLALATAVGLAAVAAVVGHALPFEAVPRGRFARLAAGVAVLFVISCVPVAGTLVWLAAAAVGLGAVARTRFQPDPERRATPEGPYRSAAV